MAGKDCGFALYSKQPQPYKNSKCFHWFVSCSFPSRSTLISSHFTRLWRSRRISQWNCYYNNCTLETCTGQRCTYQVKKKYIYVYRYTYIYILKIKTIFFVEHLLCYHTQSCSFLSDIHLTSLFFFLPTPSLAIDV